MGRSVTILSWNLAMMERSAAAPQSWELHDTEAAIRDVVLATRPDVVCYQELPGLVPFVESHAMVPANPRSHAGHLATLLRTPLPATDPWHGTAGPAVLVRLRDPDLTVANVHLAPGPAAAADRLEQLAAVVEASPTHALVVIGDTNTRLDEIRAIEAAGLLAPKPPYPTWDSRRNRFRARVAAFQAYFTRVFVSPDLQVHDMQVRRTPLQVDGHRFHLSDHYPLVVSVEPT